MDPINVNPKDWLGIKIILNDTSAGYSVIFGKFRGNLCLGMRWNGNLAERGYPGQGAYPLWFVVPDPFKQSILNQLTIMSNTNKHIDINVCKKLKIVCRCFFYQQKLVWVPVNK